MAKRKIKNNSQEAPSSFSKFFLSSEWQGLLLLILSGMMTISLLTFHYGNPEMNKLGILGYILGGLLYRLLGFTSFAVVAFLAWIGWRQLFFQPISHLLKKTLLLSLLIFSGSILLNLFEMAFPSLHVDKIHLGGDPAFRLYSEFLKPLLHPLGVSVITTSLFVGTFFYLTKLDPRPLFQALRNLWPKEWFKRKSEEKAANDLWRFVSLRLGNSSAMNQNSPKRLSKKSSDEVLAIRPDRELKQRPSLSLKHTQPPEQVEEESPITLEIPEPPYKKPKKPTREDLIEQTLVAERVFKGDFSQYEVPATSMLTEAQKVDQSQLKQDLRKQAEVLEETLQSFGIEATVGQINCGPTITSFEVHPAIGVKVQKIKALESDIALNMEARSIRIIAPIPGKAAVGIEVPNPKPQEVSYKELLESYKNSSKKCRLPLLLGKAVNGDNVISDLAKMPHLIIAGATGSGKSVCINTIVMSIVMNLRPDQVKLLMIDPKKVELTPYSKLPHMLAPVITEPQGASAALYWLVKEMERRYELLKLCGVRNIEAFNHRKRDHNFESSIDKDIPETMHYIVGIIDELADLMMVSSHDIETPIARIAQMARAVGIHLILATQRPSREVITGLIKANFPTRISFKVSSRVNSQIILDEVGAESLLGNGDMLFLPPGTSHLTRAQGAFIRDEDIHAIVEFICSQSRPRYVIPSFDDIETIEELLPEEKSEKQDSLLDQAKEVVTSSGNASTTFLQRKLKIGYARAASLIDQLEDAGVIGPAEGNKGRKVLTGAAEDSASVIETESFN